MQNHNRRLKAMKLLFSNSCIELNRYFHFIRQWCRETVQVNHYSVNVDYNTVRQKRLSSNLCLTPTGPFSCSTSIFFKVSSSLRRFNKSLPSWCSCLEQNFRHKILKLRFIHLHAPPYLIFSPQSLLWESFENEASHPRLWREKKTATFIFFWACFSLLYKLYKAC